MHTSFGAFAGDSPVWAGGLSPGTPRCGGGVLSPGTPRIGELGAGEAFAGDSPVWAGGLRGQHRSCFLASMAADADQFCGQLQQLLLTALSWDALLGALYKAEWLTEL